MRVRRFCVFISAIALCALAPATATADDSIDFRAPVRLGLGWSGPLAGGMLSPSFHEQFRILKLSSSIGFELQAGVDGVLIVPEKSVPAGSPDRGYTAIELGTGLSCRDPDGHGLLVTSVALGPLLDNPTPDESRVVGFGFALRAEGYPLYLDVNQATECEKGAAYTYIASGLSFWTELRGDAVSGAAAMSFAVGFGVDIVRSLLLPPLALALKKGCSKPRERSTTVYAVE